MDGGSDRDDTAQMTAMYTAAGAHATNQGSERVADGAATLMTGA